MNVSHAEKLPDIPAAARQRERDRVHILVVDDLPEKLLVLQSILEELDETIVTARSGEEALRLVLEQDFAVILLDVNMPGMDGLETASYIRRRKKSAHTPIIFITAYADEIHTTQGYSLGAVDYILSPIVPEVLRTKVSVFVDLFRMTQQVRKQADERIALAREQAARAAAEEASVRSTFLADAGKALTSSLDLEATQRNLLRTAVPRVADLAAVILRIDPGLPWRSELAWAFPPDKAVSTGTLTAAPAPDDALRSAIEGVLARGEAAILEKLDVAYPPAGCQGAAPAAQARLRSACVFPLVARGRIFGALVLAQGASNRSCGPEEHALGEELAARAAVALDNARLFQDLQEVDRRKSEFLAMLAHELRNPLAPIRNAVHILQLRGLDDPDLESAREIIDRQVSHMARLIDDLLDVSRLSRGKILLRKQELDLVDLVKKTVEDYRDTLKRGGLKLHVCLPDRAVYVHGDPTRLAQIVGNVLHNTSKFTDAGGEVAVALTVAPDERTATITIRDTGIGMEPSMLARVFESFTQADGSIDRARGGLGLGLSLVKGLVNLHGGDVKASSAGLGKGTEVIIHLPILAAHEVHEPPAEPATDGAVSRRILVIEDNRDAAESMRMLLVLTGHQVAVAGTGPDGLEAARQSRPDVIICDIGLPGGMDGYAVARTFRANPAFSGTLLIALTGYGQEDDQRRCRAAGFDIHLTKPVDFAELQRLIAGRTPAAR